MLSRTASILVLLTAATAGCARYAPTSSDTTAGVERKNIDPEAIRLPDLDGGIHAPFAHRDQKATVFIFITNDCPITNTYAPEIRRIVAEYESRSVDFYLLHVDPTITLEEAKKHAQDYDLPDTIVLDREHLVVETVGADVMPEAAVLVPGDQGVMLTDPVYLGRIDDRNVDFGKRRFEASQHDLRNAIDAVLAGEPVKVARTKAIGCFIPRLPEE